MPIQLDKILADIAEEKTLHPNYPNATKKQIDDAWMRVGKKNKLSVHECRSIFKVLQKKYEQERARDTSAWKLFKVMDEIHTKVDVKLEIKNEGESEVPMEEDEEYEMLEVQEDEEHNANDSSSSYPVPPATDAASGPVSEEENRNKPIKSASTISSPEKDEKPFIRNLSTGPPPTSQEERKILNSAPAASSKISVGGSSQTTAGVMQKKGVTVKKTLSTSGASISKIGVSGHNINKTPTVRSHNNSLLEVGRTIQLPESIKRKLSEDQPSLTAAKRQSLSQTSITTTPTGQQQPSSITSHNNSTLQAAETTQIKQELDDDKFTVEPQSTQGINIITIPANPSRNDITNATTTATSVASTPMNGYSPRLDEIDFRNDIIFDSGLSGNVNGVQQHQQSLNRINHTSEIINLGNFDNSLPPTFFKNLCNSSRHEALGLYVANVMNRLSARSAAKLELGILRAIIDIQSSEIEQ